MHVISFVFLRWKKYQIRKQIGQILFSYSPPHCLENSGCGFVAQRSQQAGAGWVVVVVWCGDLPYTRNDQTM